MPWATNGSAAVTGGPTVYNVSWTAPTYSYPSGSTNRSLTSAGGETSINCGTQTTRTWRATWFLSPTGWDEDYKSVTATAPSCPPEPPPTDLNLTISTSSTGTAIYVTVTSFNQSGEAVTVTTDCTNASFSGLPATFVATTPAQLIQNTYGPFYGSYGSTYEFEVSGTTVSGYQSETSSITLVAPIVSPSWSDNSLSDSFRVGEAYTDGVSASGTTPMTYSVTAGELPSGISLNSSTGAVTGTPTASGAYSFTLQASNGYGSPVTASFSGTVAKPRGEINYWNGTEWVQEPIRHWTGSAWSTATVYTFNGTEWVRTF